MAPATTFVIMFGPQVCSCEEEPIYGHTLLAVPLLLLLLMMMVILFQQSSPSTLITCRYTEKGDKYVQNWRSNSTPEELVTCRKIQSLVHIREPSFAIYTGANWEATERALWCSWSPQYGLGCRNTVWCSGKYIPVAWLAFFSVGVFLASVRASRYS